MPKYISTTGDYRIRYGGCYAKATGIPTKYAGVVVLTDEWAASSSGPYKVVAKMFYRDSSNKTRTSDEWLNKDNISFTPLPVGAINLAKSVVVLLTTIPKGNAKYRRLPHDHSIEIIDPFVQEREFLDIRPVDGIRNYFVLRAWAENKYIPAVEALESVMKHNRMGAAFDPNYFFGLSLAGDGVFLYRNAYRVARVNTEGQILLKPGVHWLSEQLSEHGLSVRRIDK